MPRLKDYGRPAQYRDFLLRFEDEQRTERVLTYLVRRILKDERLVGHGPPRVDPKESVEKFGGWGKSIVAGYPEPVIAVRRIDHWTAEVISFPDGERLSPPMRIADACSLVRELLAS